jgi:glutamyl-tRNA synthetase
VTVGRLAPTPSGYLHLGNARSFLLAWLWARQQGGQILLRIEDIDKPRCKPEYTQAAIEDLHWLGLWCGNEKAGARSASEGPIPRVPIEYVQSTRTELYRQHLNQLIQQHQAYPCTCTRKDIEEAASAPHGDEGAIYPGTCRARWKDAAQAKAETGRDPAWRFVWEGPPVTFRDEVQGEITVDPKALGDFVLWRRDDLPSYQLAVTVDDALQGVTQVLRGRDLLTSTARQLALYAALGLPAPIQWAHVPFLQDAGRRMAKRDGDLSIKSLRDSGADASKVVGYLAWSAGVIESNKPAAAIDLVELFDVARVHRNDFELSEFDA